MIDTSLDPVTPSIERRTIDFRLLGMNDILILGRYDYTFAHRQLPKHTHYKVIEFCFLDEGVQPYTICDKEYILRGGDVLVIYPYEQHGSGSSPENRGRFYWFQVRVPEKDESFLDLNPKECKKLMNALSTLSSRHFKGNRFLKIYLDRMFKAYDSDDPLKNLEIRNWALRFLLDLVQDDRRHSDTRVSPLMRKVLSFIDDQIHDETTCLEEIASIAGLSLSHFKARFKQEVGLAPGNYIISKKIELAKGLLKNTELSITDIAMDLGFSTSQYFSTTFKRYTGVTPGRYRESGSRKETRGYPRKPGPQLV